MWRASSLEKTLILGKIDNKRRAQQRMRQGWMASPEDAWCASVLGVVKSRTRLSDGTKPITPSSFLRPLYSQPLLYTPWSLTTLDLLLIPTVLPVLEFYMVEITQCINFSVSLTMMYLRVMHIVAWISNLFLFIAKWHSILWFYHKLQMMGIWVLSSFRQLWLKLLLMFIYRSLCGSSFLCNKYLGVKLLTRKVSVCDFIRILLTCFPKKLSWLSW